MLHEGYHPSDDELDLEPLGDDDEADDDDVFLDDDEDETAALLGGPPPAAMLGLRATPSTPFLPVAARPVKAPSISLLGLATLAFFSVSGGPFGIEVALAAGGPARTVQALLTLTLLSALPSAMMTAELSSALPGRAGAVYWVERGLSPLMGALTAWVSLLNTAVDASAYPGVCVDYILFGIRRWCGWTPSSTDGWLRTCSAVVLTTVVCVLNLRGIVAATRASVFLAVFSIAPFALMFALSLLTPGLSMARATGALAASSDEPAADWPLMLSVCLWSASGYDSVSFVSSEVRDSGDERATVLPRAMRLSVLAMLLTTLLPILASCAAAGDRVRVGAVLLAATNGSVSGDGGGGGALWVAPIGEWHNWTLGSFAAPAETLGGQPLGVWTCVAAVASSLGLLNAYLCTSARNVQAMAQRGWLPSSLKGERSADTTPTPALVFSAVSILLLCAFTFSELVELNMALYCTSLALEMLALLRLRWSEPQLHRPYAIPLGRSALVVAFLPQLALCVVMIWFTIRRPAGGALWVLVILSGLALPRMSHRLGSVCQQRSDARRWSAPGSRDRDYGLGRWQR